MTTLKPEISDNILLITQDTAITQSICQWLEHHGQITCMSKMEGVQNIIEKTPWNLVILDTEFLGPNTLEIMQIIKSTHSRTQILMVFALENATLISQFINVGYGGVLFKPLEEKLFVTMAVTLLENSRQERRKKERKVILAIGAHPDDVEIGCGGTLARHYIAGNILHILTLTSGEQGGDKKTRKNEAQSAAEILHANLFINVLRDTHISDGEATIHIIQNIVNQVKPTHVYTHTQHDTHQDHRNTHLATLVACRNIPNLFCYDSPSATIDFKPNLFVDITDTIEYKIQALSCYQSQINSRPYIQETFIRASAIYWGKFANYCMVEPMHVIREQ